MSERPCLSNTSKAVFTTTITWLGPTARSGSGGTVAEKRVPWQQSPASIASNSELSLILGPTGFCEPSKFCTKALFFCAFAAVTAAATCSSLKRDSIRLPPRTGRSVTAPAASRGTSRSSIADGPSAVYRIVPWPLILPDFFPLGASMGARIAGLSLGGAAASGARGAFQAYE